MSCSEGLPSSYFSYAAPQDVERKSDGHRVQGQLKKLWEVYQKTAYRSAAWKIGPFYDNDTTIHEWQ
jgi:hypothetical protein